MKKITAIGLVLCFALFCFVSCKKEAEAPKAGTAKAEDMLGLLPVDIQGVIFVDVNSAMATEFADKMIKEDESYQKYLEFVEKSGIDPQKDIFYVAVGLAGDLEGEDQEGVAVVNMKYDPETILGLIKEKAAEEEQEIQEEKYGDHTLYKIWQDGEPIEFSFIDESNIVAGNEIHVKSVLDVLVLSMIAESPSFLKMLSFFLSNTSSTDFT